MTISAVIVRFFLVVIVISCSSTATSGKYKQPFFDPSCYTLDCSWSWQNPLPGTQDCERKLYSNPFSGVCPDPFPPPSSADERPGPASNVAISDINRIFHWETGETEQYTCLSINYTINQFVASKVKGLQLSLRSIDLTDVNFFYCMNLNFSQGLQAHAVRDNVTSNQCFCGVKPGDGYTVTIRSMPVDGNPDDSNDSKVEETYRPPGCSDSSKVNDVRCQGNEQARWKPKCINFDQQSQSGDYDIVEISFDAAPAQYDFDVYKVLVYINLVNQAVVDFQYYNLDSVTVVNRTCAASDQPLPHLLARFNTTKSYFNRKWAEDVESESFLVKVQPLPSSQTCLDARGVQDQCTLSESKKFSLIADPCKGNPCGHIEGQVFGSCISNEELYTCDCIHGYRVWQKTCIVDPCQVLASNGQNWSQQCANGECAYTQDQKDFYCNCHDDFEYLEDSRECVARNPPIGMIIGVVIPSCVVGLLLFLAAFYVFRKQRRPPEPIRVTPDPISPVPRPPAPQVQQPERVYGSRRVLPIFSDDHPLHYEVVQCFCRLLQLHCKCDVKLLDWEKSIGPTVEMWLTTEIEKADIVLLLCSKGTGLKYKDKARLETPKSSVGVYGDVFLKALTLLDEYFRQDNANDKFVVAYFDYSREKDIPMSFRRFATYHLMQRMESLFLRIHNRGKDSPHSCRRVLDLEESRFQSLEMGQPLHKAIEAMKALIRSDPKWYEKHNNKQDSASSSPILSPQHLMDSLGPHISVDSAYESLDRPQPPEGFFKTTSSVRSSDGSNFEDSLQQFLSFPSSNKPMSDYPNVLQMQDQNNYCSQPQTQFFSDDFHLTMTSDPDDAFHSDQFYSDIEMANTGRKQGRAVSFT